MREKLQRFGGAMFTPVLLFAFNGIIIALSILFKNELIMGSIAAEGTVWWRIWDIIAQGGWIVFHHMELLFVVALPIGLAKKANARASMEALIIYLTFIRFVGKILEYFGPAFNVDFTQEVGGTSGLTMIGGIKTLDTSIIGAIAISAIVVWLHNKYFDKKLPDWLGVFQGSSLIVILGFFLMLPLAVVVSYVWPVIQGAIASLQGLMANSGTAGVGLYVFLERILIPTGLHHFIYQPFTFGPAVVPQGTTAYWLENLNEFASTAGSMRDLFPAAGFTLHNFSKVFAPIGISAAFYATAQPEKRKKTLAILIPTALTAMMAGITEPFEFTFLFIAPQLFFVHALIASLGSATAYALGLSSDIGSGLIRSFAQFLAPMSINHMNQILIWLGVGISMSIVYFVIFRYAILKFDFKTPGREDTEEVKMYTKKDYKEKQKKTGGVTENPYLGAAEHYLIGFGGPDNIDTVNNCATRLRIGVLDETLVKNDEYFKEGGAHGLVRKGKSFQVIVGLDVPQVREQFEQLIQEEGKTDISQTT